MTALAAAPVLALSAMATPAAAQSGPASPGAQVRADHGDGRPLVIGHRGAAGHRPEHTLAAYRFGIESGADYIEPDLVSTKDGVLVCRHENDISGTTDVADHPEFADRRTTKTIDGVEVTGWFTEDFTLAELKTLRAKERLPDLRPGNAAYDGRYEVPTFQQVIDLARREGHRRGHAVGLYPETKHPTYFDSIGLSLEEKLDRALERNGLDRPGAKVFVQSFEVGNLQELDHMLRVPLVQLLWYEGDPPDEPGYSYADMTTPAGLRRVATYADGIGPEKTQVIPWDGDDYLADPTALVDDAHAAGLVVHPYTFRSENTFLPADFRVGDDPAAHGDAAAEYEAYFDAGVDGLFSDFPDEAVAARDAWVGQRRAS